MKMLMPVLTQPFMVHNLTVEEQPSTGPSLARGCTTYQMVLISAKILWRFCMEYSISSCMRDITPEDLVDLQEMAVDLLELLKSNLPDKCGEGRLEL